MVPFGDLHLFGAPGVRRAVHNLGGIANVTLLPGDGDPERVVAFDTGPANCLLDEAAEATTGAPFDRDGALAAAGRVDPVLLARLLDHPYLQLPPPKTTGREVFNLREIVPEGVAAWTPADLLATLTAFTAASIAEAYRRWVLPHGLDEVLLAGGGPSTRRSCGAARAPARAAAPDLRGARLALEGPRDPGLRAHGVRGLVRRAEHAAERHRSATRGGGGTDRAPLSARRR
jgi:1,6-anhydro-N-acetylmuramate kinase